MLLAGLCCLLFVVVVNCPLSIRLSRLLLCVVVARRVFLFDVCWCVSSNVVVRCCLLFIDVCCCCSQLLFDIAL